MHRTRAAAFRGRRLECLSESYWPAPPPSGFRLLEAVGAQKHYRMKQRRRLLALPGQQLPPLEALALVRVLPPALVPAPEREPSRSAYELQPPQANSSAQSCPGQHQERAR